MTEDTVMIEMMISGETPDVSAIHLQTKNYAARLCEEQWKYYLCTKLSQLREVMDKKPELP